MKKITAILLTSLLFMSCVSNNKNKTHGSSPSHVYINVVENLSGVNIAYTEDGHTIICETDSTNNYIVYYAKFDDDAGKKGFDRVKEKAVRIEMDSSLDMLTGFVSAYGGASCKIDDDGKYQLNYFDEEMNCNNVETHEIRMEEQTEGKDTSEFKIKRIIYFLTIAYDVAKRINERNIEGWNNVVLALEPSISIINHEVMIQEKLYDPKAKEHMSRLYSTAEGLTRLSLLFHETVSKEQ